MYTKALIYSKPNCPYCLKAENALNKAGIEIEKKILGQDITIEEFREILPNAKTVPQIYLYNNSEPVYIGGYIEMLTELKHAGLSD
jgi:glutaredoxin 3